MTADAVRNRLAIALDKPDLESAVDLAKAVRPHIGVAKVGLELFSAAGHKAVRTMHDLGMDVFLDVKLHDIPNTVNAAAAVLGSLGARYLTVHSCGGESMMNAAVAGLEAGADDAGIAAPMVLAVTVLTSDPNASPELLTTRLRAAVAAKCRGVVCAAPDLPIIKAESPLTFTVTPGIRPAGAPTHDQSRVATPADAIAAGADMLVIGRAVSAEACPAEAAERIAEEVADAL